MPEAATASGLPQREANLGATWHRLNGDMTRCDMHIYLYTKFMKYIYIYIKYITYIYILIQVCRGAYHDIVIGIENWSCMSQCVIIYN